MSQFCRSVVQTQNPLLLYVMPHIVFPLRYHTLVDLDDYSHATESIIRQINERLMSDSLHFHACTGTTGWVNVSERQLLLRHFLQQL